MRRWMGFAAAVMAAGVMAGCGAEKAAETAVATVAAADTTAAEEDAGAKQKAVGGEEAAQAEGESQEAAELLVAAAASLKNVYEEELIPLFQEQNPGVIVKGVYDSSGKLQTQIEEGLEADVFMSAANKQMDALNEKGLIASDTMVDLLENKIVLIVPSGSETALTGFEDIAKAESIALGDPAFVPVGQYSEEALKSLGIWDEIQDRVSFGTNVTEVLAQVAAASADAGIVYATDAASMPEDVTVIAEAPEGSLKKKVIYPVAVTANSAHPAEAEAFVGFLQTEEAMAAFAAYGFAPGN